MSILENFDVVGVPRTFSVAEVRIMRNGLSFNIATASELGYPCFVRLFVSRDKTQIALQPCNKEDMNAMEFFTEKYSSGKRRAIKVGNRALTTLLRAGINADLHIAIKAPGVRFAEENVVIFDIRQAAEAAKNGGVDVLSCVPTPARSFAALPAHYFSA